MIWTEEQQKEINELKAELIAQDHRPLVILGRYLAGRKKWPKGDPRHVASQKALIYRMIFSPGSTAAAGGLVALVTIYFLYDQGEALKEQNKAIQTQNELIQEQVNAQTRTDNNQRLLDLADKIWPSNEQITRFPGALRGLALSEYLETYNAVNARAGKVYSANLDGIEMPCANLDSFELTNATLTSNALISGCNGNFSLTGLNDRFVPEISLVNMLSLPRGSLVVSLNSKAGLLIESSAISSLIIKDVESPIGGDRASLELNQSIIHYMAAFADIKTIDINYSTMASDFVLSEAYKDVAPITVSISKSVLAIEKFSNWRHGNYSISQSILCEYDALEQQGVVGYIEDSNSRLFNAKDCYVIPGNLEFDLSCSLEHCLTNTQFKETLYSNSQHFDDYIDYVVRCSEERIRQLSFSEDSPYNKFIIKRCEDQLETVDQ